MAHLCVENVVPYGTWITHDPPGATWDSNLERLIMQTRLKLESLCRQQASSMAPHLIYILKEKSISVLLRKLFIAPNVYREESNYIISQIKRKFGAKKNELR